MYFRIPQFQVLPLSLIHIWADDIIVVLPASAGEKNYESEEKVKLINPKITAEGYKIGTRGFTNYILSADDMVKA